MKTKEIKLFWWRGGDFINFGDEMNPHIVNYVTGKKIIKSEAYNSELFAIGSVLHRTQENKSRILKKITSEKFFVWGTGTLEPINLKAENILDVSLLRGPLTASLFKNSSKVINYGDPGLLSSEVWKVNNNKSYKWGLIVHHSQYHKDWIKKFINQGNILFIDIKDPDLKNIMFKINQCNFIASSSLHGLIVADSYNIPNFWLWDENLHRGAEWKFMDYFLSVKRDLYTKYNPNLLNSLDDINLEEDFQYLKDIEKVKRIIFDSFPKELI